MGDGEVGAGSDWRTVDWRAWLQTRQFAAPGLQKGLEGAAIGVVVLAAAGLAWAVAAPTRSSDDVTAPARIDASPAAFAGFDPFFRLAQGTGGSTVVTTLDLSLHGIRSDRASGRGSAIIALPDGTQNSYAVGEDIVPGATLAAVGFDSVTIRRNGANETLYLDQSGEAPAITTPTAVAPDPFAAIRAGGPTAPSLIADVSAEPRMRGGHIDGYVLKPGAGGAAFAAAGLKTGDVLLTIDGKRLGEGAGIEQLAGGGQAVRLTIDRGGAVMTLTVGGGR